METALLQARTFDTLVLLERQTTFALVSGNIRIPGIEPGMEQMGGICYEQEE